MNTILDSLDASSIVPSPFPYADQKDTVDPDLCRRLVDEFPLDVTIALGKHGNKRDRFSFTAYDALQNQSVSPLWKEFISAHLTPEFYHLMLDRFEPFILKEYPKFVDMYGRPRDLRVGVRHSQTNKDDADILLEAQVCCNLPPPNNDPIRLEAHVDLLDKLFTALLYLRPSHDTDPGGDLGLFKYKDEILREGVVPMQRRRLDVDAIDCIHVVPYEQNRMATFINTFHAIHTRFENRAAGSYPRLFFMVNCYVNKPLYDYVTVPEGVQVPS